MTSPFPTAGKTQQTIALAFAVASLQNPGMELQHIPQALLDAAAASQATLNNAERLQQPIAPPFSLAHAAASLSGVRHSTMAAATAAAPPPPSPPPPPPRPGASAAAPAEDDVTEEADGGDDNERRLARSRERNREHARRTRLRKKAQLQALQSKVKGLEAERQVLKQKVEECGIASILIGLSSGAQDHPTLNLLDSTSKQASGKPQRSDMVAVLSGAKRKRFISEAIGEQPHQNQHRLTINVEGRVTVIGAGKSHINWKTGVYRDQEGVQRQLTSEQLEDLRRERNRMHAKMTRSRKKCFIATIEKAIAELEAENSQMRAILSKVALLSASQMVTPIASPTLVSTKAPVFYEEEEDDEDEEEDEDSDFSHADEEEVVSKSNKKLKSEQKEPKAAPRISHGFRLDG